MFVGELMSHLNITSQILIAASTFQTKVSEQN